MITYCVSSDCVAALLEAGESMDVRAAVSACLSAAGCRPWRDMEAELYATEEGSLLIARPLSPAQRLCRRPVRAKRRFRS